MERTSIFAILEPIHIITILAHVLNILLNFFHFKFRIGFGNISAFQEEPSYSLFFIHIVPTIDFDFECCADLCCATTYNPKDTFQWNVGLGLAENETTFNQRKKYVLRLLQTD